jgi:Beta-xylosidase
MTLLGYVNAANLPVVMQAEAGQSGSDFQVLEENGVTFVRPSTDVANSGCPGNDTKVITFTVPFTETGNYQVYVRVRVGSGGYSDDSFYLGKGFGLLSSTTADSWYIVNGIVPFGYTASTDVVTGAGSAGTLTWKWINISQYLNSQSPVVYAVDNISSPKTFRIGSRENGLDIDKIAFGKADYEYTVNNLDLVQTGTPVGGFPDEAYRQVKTFVNPVLSGDHPDQTLMRMGDDFYTTGSSFHFTPYVPVYHSTDLVHWEIISRVVAPTNATVTNDAPSAGIWQGALAQFGGCFWVYYSIGSVQYFSKATSMTGPWSAPERITSSTVTGYDNSIFVDNNGTPYMLMKNGKYINRIQEVDKTSGQLTSTLINCDFINASGQYSWAEGPVMCKRDGWYYYFIAGNVGGGQYVLRTQTLTEDPNSWQSQGNFFATLTDAAASFRSPNHIAQPIQLNDGTWWTLSHCYETVGPDDWSGKGRQGLLHQVNWDASGKPTGKAAASTPQLMPELSGSGIPWTLPRSDYFDKSELDLPWYFLNKSAATKYSLTEKTGWLTLNPGTGSSHVLQKEGGYYYSLVTKVDFDATEAGQEAGIYLTNGNESVTASVYSGYNGGKKIGFRFNGSTVEVNNNAGNILWLKVERKAHQLTGYYSPDGVNWNQIGAALSSVDLDKGQPNYNWWVGTGNGLYAKKKKACFDLFMYRDAFTAMQAIGHNNYFGLEKKDVNGELAMTNTTAKGGWLMLGGVELGKGDRVPSKIEIEAAAVVGGTLEVWMDDLEGAGSKIATINVGATGGTGNWQRFRAEVSCLSGQHDIFLRWSGVANAFMVKNVQFFPGISSNTPVRTTSDNCDWLVYPNPFKEQVMVESSFGKSVYTIYNLDGTTAEEGTLSASKQELGKRLIPGIYLLRLASEGHSKEFKLYKKK